MDFRQFITVRDDTARTDSLKVAEAFGKRHKDVLRAIKALDCSKEFVSAHFCAITRKATIGDRGSIREFPCYEMTKDGFVFLVMGFVGKKAAAIKEGYILAFNWIAEQLVKREENQGIWDTTIGTNGVHVLSELINKKTKHLPKPQQHATRMTLWKRLHTRFSVPRAELIPVSEMESAANFLAAYVFEGEVEQKPVQNLKPVVWPRPQRVGQPNGEGLPRTHETVEKILLALLYWGMDNFHDRQVLDSYHEAINDLLDLQVTGRTEMNEALLLMSAANSYINRWQGHGRRIRNIGG